MDKPVSSAALWLNKSGSDELLNGIFQAWLGAARMIWLRASRG
jgi:hypothetical protein